jgi:threonine/homoserine/homoserine lactone efflux protein
MKFKEFVEKVNKIKFKDWNVTWKTFLWFSWEWIWKFCVICVVSVMGCYLYASLNDTLSNYQSSSIYGTWMWTAFGVMYFATLIYVIYRIATAK